jgi:pyruvate/2-oxoglutarate dehydrogenase complex dihydrolipoamide dehydrogenase (E3) component
VYAAGDCTGDQQFTHYAGFQGAIAARNALLPLSDPGVIDPERVPACVFTAPEIARVGATEAQAKAADGVGGVGVAFRRMGQVDRAITMGEGARGFIKLVYRKKDGAILGATVMGVCAPRLEAAARRECLEPRDDTRRGADRVVRSSPDAWDSRRRAS